MKTKEIETFNLLYFVRILFENPPSFVHSWAQYQQTEDMFQITVTKKKKLNIIFEEINSF